MAQSHMAAPPADGAGRAVAALDRLLAPLENIFNLLAAFSILFLMLLAVAQIFGRALLDMPIPGFIDFVEQAMVMFAFLGVAYCQRENGHIRMDLLVGNLRGRPMWAAEFITTLAILILMVLLVWGSWAHFQRSFDFGEPWWSRDSSMDIRLPLWPAKLVVPVAFFVICLRLALQLFVYGRALLTGQDQPVGVPLHADAATQAAMEAAQVSGRDDD